MADWCKMYVLQWKHLSWNVDILMSISIALQAHYKHKALIRGVENNTQILEANSWRYERKPY